MKKYPPDDYYSMDIIITENFLVFRDNILDKVWAEKRKKIKKEPR